MKFTKPSAPTIADLCIMVITFSGETHATSASFMPSHAPPLNSMQLDRMEFLDRFKNFIVKITLWLYLNIHMKIQVRILEFFHLSIQGLTATVQLFVLFISNT